MKILTEFLVISLFAGISVYANACVNEGTHNYYMFSVYDRSLNGNDYEVRINQSDFIKKLNKNWIAYTAGEISQYDAAKLRAYALRKGDKQMNNYLRQLDLYLKAADTYKETWTYPTKKQIQWRTVILNNVRAAALKGIHCRIRSQYALLYMRCNMLLKQYVKNLNFWESIASTMPNSVYKDMMLDIYAGSLAHSGKGDEACEIFASLGDIPSISTWMMGKRNLKGICAVYHRNANAATLPFLIQEFVNNAQETVDDERAKKTGGMNIYGKLFVNNIYRKEVSDFCIFADKVVAEGKTHTPILWKSAAAWLHYMFDNSRTAQTEIDAAINMDGSDRMKDNARAIRLYISAANAPQSDSFENYLTEELDWLDKAARNEMLGDGNNYPNHYSEVLDRLVNEVLVPKYDGWNRSEVATALLAVIRNQNVSMKQSETGGWNMEYNSDYFNRLDTVNAYAIKSYLDYLQHKHTENMDRWAVAHINKNVDYLNDIIGTKYLCKADYRKAVEYLEKVPLTFLDKQNISPYMANRSFMCEKWFTSVKHNIEVPWGEENKTQLSTNLKLLFALKMNDMEAKFVILNNEERMKAAYDIATMYYQASHCGDCWFLTHYGWSVTDSARTDEVDFVSRAINYLNISKMSNQFELKEKSLYALAYIPIQPWRDEAWDNQKNTFVMHYFKTGRQYKAFVDLSNFERENSRATHLIYITRCDVLKQFNKIAYN